MKHEFKKWVSLPSHARIIGVVTSFDLIYYNSSFDAWSKYYGHLELYLLFIKCSFLNTMNSKTHLLFAKLFFTKKKYWLNIELKIKKNIRWFQKELRNESDTRKQHQQVQKTLTVWCQNIDNSLWYGEFTHLIHKHRKRRKNIPKQSYHYSY